MERYGEIKFPHDYCEKNPVNKIPGAYLIKYLEKHSGVRTYFYVYDNFGNSYNYGYQTDGGGLSVLKSRNVFIKNSLRKTPMSNEEIDMFKTLLKDADSIDIVNTLIDLNFNKIKEIDNLTKVVEKQNDMIQNLFHIVSNQQLCIENLNIHCEQVLDLKN